MNKIYLLIITFAIFNFSIIAQPVLNYSNMTPPIGRTYTIHIVDTTGFSVGNDGANITWDYSSITSASSVSYEYIDPSTGASSTSYPGANSCTQDPNGGYGYWHYDNSKYEMLGMYTPAGTVMFNHDAETFMTFPFTYNSISNDNFACNYSTGTNFSRTGSVTTTAVGYGTLIMPFGTYNNVLKIKVEESYQDEFDIGAGPQTSNYSAENYYWYLPGVPEAILTQMALTNPYTGTTKSVYHLDQNNISLYTKQIISDENIHIYPNPVKDYLNISVTNPLIKNANYQIVDINSRVIHEGNLSAHSNIDLSKFSSGLYLLKLTIANDIKTYRIIKK